MGQGASGQLMGDRGDVKLFHILHWRGCHSRVVALKSLGIELFWKSCFGKQLAAGAAPEAMDVQMSGNRCVYQQHEREMILVQVCS